MAKVHILNVTVHNNPAPFFTPFQFEIHFECLEKLQDDLEFKIIYVGSAETYEFDQTLDQIVVDAVPQGQFKFMFQADPPDTAKIPADDAVGVTVILITASYHEQEFVRVGYYVTNEYEDPELRENPPTEPQFHKLIRTIAANEPRVTKFKINWETKPQQTTATANGVTGTMVPGAPVSRVPPSESQIINESSNQQGDIEINKENINFNTNNSLKLNGTTTNSNSNSQTNEQHLNENNNFNNFVTSEENMVA